MTTFYLLDKVVNIYYSEYEGKNMFDLDKEKLELLKDTANEIRKLIIEMLAEAGSGHPAGALGMADIFSCLYFYVLNINPEKPDDPKRDRLILSNGHICPVLYAALALAGFLPVSELKTLRKINSRLQGHPHRLTVPGIENTSGPLGEGLSQAIGIALAAKLDKLNNYIYCIMSDGEQQEGNTWEAVMFAGKYKLNKLITIIDRNRIQIDGTTEEVMPLDSLCNKYKAFNWHVKEIDGHNFEQIIETINEAQQFEDKPTCIIADTISGKGVSFMENNYLWHGKAPDKEEAKLAIAELVESSKY